MIAYLLFAAALLFTFLTPSPYSFIGWLFFVPGLVLHARQYRRDRSQEWLDSL